MKSSVQKMAYAAISCIFAMSCTTNVMVHEPDPIEKDDSKGKEISLNFRIMQNSFTRAGNDEDKIENLYLAFYAINGSEKRCLKVVEAETTSDANTFTTTFDMVDDEVPNAVVAYANISDPTSLENALTANPTSTNLVNANGNHIMTSARYYDTNNGNTDTFFSSIKDSDIKDGGTIEINLERIAAKVTVTNNVKTTQIKAFDYNGEGRKLDLTLTGWSVSGTDKSTYLLKNNGNSTYSEMATELGSNWTWNVTAAHSFKWAHSVNWGETSFPTPGNESASASANYLTISQITNNIGESSLFHETTRSASMYDTPNARPSVILAGQYTIQGENAAQTLYTNGSLVLTEDELLEYFAEKNTAKAEIFVYNGFISGLSYKTNTSGGASSLYDAASIKDQLGNVFKIKTPNNNLNNTLCVKPVTLQVILNEESDLLTTGSTTIKQEWIDGINDNLVKVMGLWEVYDGGRCFFHIPIEHTGKKTDSDGTKTGSYGLVRNHHYNITINSIEGMGIGVPSSDTYLGEWEYPSNPDVTKDVKYSISINPWNEVNQDVNIPKK